MAAALVLTIALVPAPIADASGLSDDDRAPALWHASGRLSSVAPHAFPSSSPTDFGAAVAIDGETAIVGAPYEDTVYVYDRVGPTWVQSDTLTSDAEGFGTAIAIDGDTIAVGDEDGSAVRVFERGDGDWGLAATLTIPEATCFGSALSLEQGLLAAADPCKTDSVYLFERGPDGWSLSTSLAVSGDTLFGRAVDLSGETLVVGGESLRAFERTETGWSNPTIVNERTGAAVAIEDDTVATGWRATVLVFERTDDGDSWTQVAALEPKDGSPFQLASERFGWTLDVGDGVVAAGAWKDDGSPAVAHLEQSQGRECAFVLVAGACVPEQPGAVYVFEEQAGAWQQATKLVPEHADGQDFGSAVAVESKGETLLAGAPGHPSAARGFVEAEDSVHVFTRSTPVSAR